MKKFEQNKVLPRYTFFVVLLTFVAIAVVGKSAYVMTVKRDYWMEVAKRQSHDSITVKPQRGDLLSCDKRLLASTLPEYQLYVDFVTMKDTETDTLWAEKLDSICDGLHEIFPGRTAEEFRKRLSEGYEKNKRYCPIWPKHVDYSTMQAVKSLPLFRLSKNKSGFNYNEFPARTIPNGGLCGRTIGLLDKETWKPKCGLELACDSILRGTEGMKHRDKILNRYVDIIDIPAVDGSDVVTTIDIGMQDIAEKSLRDMLKRPDVNGEMGVAIVMEVETGDVKAIVNLSKCGDGEYYETLNNAVSYACEPGSVFKTASVLAAIDDEEGPKVDTSYVIATGGGVREMYTAKMRDHNWNRGGYGTINLAKAMEKSSNIGVSVAIDHKYHAHPERYIDALDRMGIRDSLPIPIKGYRKPNIRYPNKKKDGSYAFEAKTVLPWMSIGYETMITPINTLTFYNAIANNGKMVAPRFIKEVVRNGEVLQEFPVTVMRENICKHPESITTMQKVLEHVVSRGTGGPVKSSMIPIAGKTGTAQVSRGKGGYKNGVVGYWLSFAGYFPADKPKYSCIVCIKKWGTPASGGLMSGVVVKNIAEGIMASTVKTEETSGEKGSPLPEVKPGNILAADYLLTNLGFNCLNGWTGAYSFGDPIWGSACHEGDKGISLIKNDLSARSTMPDVTGMGARDAVFLLESKGMKVKLTGRGKVLRQSIPVGTEIKKNQVCQLELDVRYRAPKDTVPTVAPPAVTPLVAKAQTATVPKV